jgi:hypothetical protein
MTIRRMASISYTRLKRWEVNCGALSVMIVDGKPKRIPISSINNVAIVSVLVLLTAKA